MLTNAPTIRKAVAVLMLVAAGFHAPVSAESVGECLEETLELCADTLEDCNYFEKVAVGFVCTVMLAACSAESISISLS